MNSEARSIFGVFAFLTTTSIRNRFRTQAKQLRSPRYLFALVFGVEQINESLALGFVTARVMESVFIGVGILSVLTVVTLAGTLDSFAQASERTLIKMAGLRLSESTVERTTPASSLAATMARTASAANCLRMHHTVQPAGRRAADMGADRGAKAIHGLEH